MHGRCDRDRSGNGSSRGWLAFALGLAVGLALSGLWSPERSPSSAVRGALCPGDGTEARRTENLDQWDSDGMRAARHWPEDAAAR